MLRRQRDAQVDGPRQQPDRDAAHDHEGPVPDSEEAPLGYQLRAQLLPSTVTRRRGFGSWPSARMTASPARGSPNAPQEHDAASGPLGAKRSHRHREAALGRSRAPALRYRLQLAEHAFVELRQLSQLRRVAGLLQPSHGLTHLADRAAFEREAAGLDDRLVADVEGPEPRLPPERDELFADPARGELQPAALGVRGRLGDEPRQSGGGPDGIAGAEQDTVLDPVGEEGPSLVVEQVLLVPA